MNRNLKERKANQTAKNIPPQSLLKAFLSHVEKTPDIPAVISEEGVLTYQETALRAASFAVSLKNAGLHIGDRVAVSIPRGSELICAVLGVLWAGGAYVPVNCTQPVERRRSIYAQAEIRFCITESDSSASLVTECCNIFADLTENQYVLPYIADPNETAYIIFTSGSTGKPKGVEISHAGAWNTIADVLDRFSVSGQDRAIAVSAIDFDLSVFDIFGMLSAGGAVSVLTDKTQKEPLAWIQRIQKDNISIWNSVPALLEMMLISLKPNEILSSLKCVLISGDKIRPELYKLLKAHTENCRFIALGGATEASVWSNFFEVTYVDESWQMIPYGKPLANQKFRVMTENGDAEDNEIGELWIGGAGLAKGYISQPELTAKVFVEDNGERWYCTGDFGYYLPDDTIIFCGRKDNQVKINGFRIELGEIENHLADLPQAEQSVVLVGDGTAGKSLSAVIQTVQAENTAEIPKVPSVVGNEADETDCMIADFMHSVLYENGEPVFKDTELSGDGKGIVSLWNTFMSKMPENSVFTKTEFSEKLNKKTELLRSIISGQISSAAMLDDDLLAPARLMQTAELKQLVRKIAVNIRTQAQGTDGKFRLTLMFGREGDIFLPLMQELSDIQEKLQIVFLETSSGMIQTAKEKFSEIPLQVEYHKTDYVHLSASLAGNSDAVVAVNGLHMFTKVLDGLRYVKLLLKQSGILYVSEPEKMTALGLISAGVIEHGFTDYEEIRRNSSMMPYESWCIAFRQTGFGEISAQKDEETGMYSYTCKLVEQSVPDETALKSYCAEKLVPYMIPEHFCYTTAFPLTANGKIDRNSMKNWFSSKTTGNGTLPQTETQKRISDIWNGFFHSETIYLEDNFFEIGGDSLLATRMLNSLSNTFGIHISMKEFFDAPILEQLASAVDELITDDDMEEGEL